MSAWNASTAHVHTMSARQWWGSVMHTWEDQAHRVGQLVAFQSVKKSPRQLPHRLQLARTLCIWCVTSVRVSVRVPAREHVHILGGTEKRSKLRTHCNNTPDPSQAVWFECGHQIRRLLAAHPLTLTQEPPQHTWIIRQTLHTCSRYLRCCTLALLTRILSYL